MVRDKKADLGCGTDIMQGYVNADSSPLPGVDEVRDLSVFPWPFEDEQFEEALLINVLEHLPNTIGVMEEIWRILKVGGKATIRVPYWNSKDAHVDPTHVSYFHEESLDFYDPKRYRCKRRPYYSTARYGIETIHYYTKLGDRYVKTGSPLVEKLLGFLAKYLNNII